MLNAEGTLRAIQIINICRTFIASGDLVALWSSMRALQLQSYTSLATVRYPSHVQTFNNLEIKLATTDYFGDYLGVVYEKFGLRETPPFSEQFEQYGIGGLNNIENSGSYFFYLFFIPIELVFCYLVNRCAVWKRRHLRARKIGMKVYNPDPWGTFRTAQFRLFLETYSDLVVMTYLMYIGWFNPNGELDLLWASSGQNRKFEGEYGFLDFF